jgi:hypothetical protein
VTLGELDRPDEEILVYDELVERFGDADNPKLREQVGRALANKCARLAALDRSEEATVVLDELAERFGDAEEPGLRELVGRVLAIRWEIGEG